MVVLWILVFLTVNRLWSRSSDQPAQLVMKKLLKANPTKINLYSIVAFSEQLDAQDWVEALKPVWKVGYDVDGSVFKKYCQHTTPCTVVNLPDQGIVLRHTGLTTIEELKQYTGEWN